MVGTFDWHVQTDTFYSDAHFAQMFSVDPAKDEKGAPLAVYLAGIHAEDVEQVTGALNHALATGEKYIQEYRLLQKDGTVRCVEARGKCLSDENDQLLTSSVWWWTSLIRRRRKSVSGCLRGRRTTG